MGTYYCRSEEGHCYGRVLLQLFLYATNLVVSQNRGTSLGFSCLEYVTVLNKGLRLGGIWVVPKSRVPFLYP